MGSCQWQSGTYHRPGVDFCFAAGGRHGHPEYVGPKLYHCGNFTTCRTIMPESDNLGQKFLSFFIKEETPPTGASFTPAQAAALGSQPRPATPPGPPSQPLPPGSVDAKFAEHLANVLAKNNQPGPDYFEFREALRNLADLGLPEDKQFQAAWATFKAMGGAPDVSKLSSTANMYLTSLSADREAFGKSVDAAIAERVGGLEKEQQQLAANNEALAKQLAQIQQQLAANNERLAAIGGEISEQSTRLTQNRQNYEATYGLFTQQIKNDINRIAQYLK
jgi:hypothetical protein